MNDSICELKVLELVKLKYTNIARKNFQTVFAISRSTIPTISINDVEIVGDNFHRYFEVDMNYANRVNLKGRFSRGDVIKIMYNKIAKRKLFIIEEN